MKRRRLSKANLEMLWQRQRGLCGCNCGEFLGAGPYHVEHTLALALGGVDDLNNLTLMRVDCHKSKSARDIKMIRKADRQRKAFLGLKVRRGRKLLSRGFSRYWRKRLDGYVERRT